MRISFLVWVLSPLFFFCALNLEKKRKNKIYQIVRYLEKIGRIGLARF